MFCHGAVPKNGFRDIQENINFFFKLQNHSIYVQISRRAAVFYVQTLSVWYWFPGKMKEKFDTFETPSFSP